MLGKKIKLNRTLLLFLILSFFANAQDVKRAAQYFVQKCASCHTIGNPDSDLDGPDLKDAIEYSITDLNEAYTSMEEEIGEKIDDALRADLTAFIKSESVLDILKEAIEASENSFGDGLEPGDVAIGKALYNGTKRFENGAVSCMSCHDQFGKDMLGGSLGTPLAGIYEKMGKTRLFNGIRNSKYKVMKHVYAENKVTDQEAVHLTTYLESVKGEPSSAGVTLFIGHGIFVLIVCFALIAFIYKDRLRDA